MGRIIGNRDRQHERALFEAFIVRQSATLQRAIRREIAATMISAADAYEKYGDIGLFTTQNRHKETAARILYAGWNAAIRAAGTRISRGIKGAYPSETKREEITKPEWFEMVLLEYINAYGADEVVKITTTTQEQIKQVIANSRNAGLGVVETAEALRQFAPELSKIRALTIARTETHAAAGFSQQAVMKATGLEFRREWVAAIDGRERQEHADANGQTIGQGEKFVVAGEQLDFPGDPAGSAANVINCRCMEGFEVI